MLHAETQCLIDILLPLLQRLVGQGVHQVDTDIRVAHVLRQAYNFLCLLAAVPAVEEREFRIIERLHADAQSVDTHLPPRLEFGFGHVRRIGFDGHLFGLLHGQCVQQPCQIPVGNLRRCTATQVDRAYRLALRQIAAAQTIFPDHGIDIHAAHLQLGG